MTTLDNPDISESYKNTTKPLDGTVSHLTEAQQQALKDLWAKILNHFDATANKPIKVTQDQVKATHLSVAGISTSDAQAVDQWYAANKKIASDPKLQTVQDKMYLSGEREAVVPGKFKPLFSDDRDTRLFANAFWQACMLHESPDAYLLGFLRASVWKVDQAFNRVVVSVGWRAAQAIDELMWEGELGMHDKLLNDGVLSRIGYDKLGYPINIIRVKLNIPKERGDGIVERYAAFALEQTSIIARDNGERATLVYDFDGFGLGNIDKGFIKTLLTFINDSYPQLFSATIQYVDSWLFSGLWKVISGWLDPQIAKRTVISKNIDQLENFIDKDQIITRMGGSMDYTYKYVYPTKQENIKMFDTESRLRAESVLELAVDAILQTTKDWVAKPGVAGYADQPRAQATDAFRSATLALDPYIRARFLTERTA